MSDQWRKYQGALVSAKAPHQEVFTQNLNSELKKNNAFFARWITNFDCKRPTSFWYIVNDQEFTLDEFSHKVRNQIKKGLKNLKVEQLSAEDMLDKGFSVYIKAFEAYKTISQPLSKEVFNTTLLAFDKNHFWGVFNAEGELIGFSQNKMKNDVCEFSITKFHPAYLKLRPSEALFYTMTDYYLNNLKVKYIHNGTRSISHQTNIQEFLINKFKFRKAYCYLHIKYQPFFGLAVSCLFPFRKFFSVFNVSLFRSINSILLQEEIRRNCKKELLC